jgi:hypothetical protein
MFQSFVGPSVLIDRHNWKTVEVTNKFPLCS